MTTFGSGAIRNALRPIFGAIRTPAVPVVGHADQPPRPALPFLTISRQAGAGAWTLAQRLVERLNASRSAEPQWTCWDRELVEKVASDHHIASQLIESLEDSSHSWLADLLTGMSLNDSTDSSDEARVYHKVAATIRALAQVGHVVIVGRGGFLVTRSMPGGIHVRLVAPLEHRVRNMQRQLNLSPDAALAWVRQTDRNREQFYRRYWPGHVFAPELFALTLNSAVLSEEQILTVLLPLLDIVPAAAIQGV